MAKKLNQIKREQLLDELYETVLQPDRYDQLMEAWADYLHHSSAVEGEGSEAGFIAALDDPELERHFNRASAMLERMTSATGSMLDADAANAEDNIYIQISANGEITMLNDGAKQILNGQKELSLLIEQLESKSAQQLRHLLGMLRIINEEKFLAILIHELDEDQPLYLSAYSKLSADGNSYEILIRSLSVPWNEGLTELLMKSFGLTSSEIEIVQNLINGYSQNEIAARRNRSVHTIRAQVKSVLKKTRAHNQAGLIRMILLFYQICDFKPVPGGTGDVIRARLELLLLPDGRSMEVHFQGPQSGLPVVFVHGMLDGTDITPKINDLLENMKIRLICPVRPGFGRSDPLKSVKDAPKIFADDLAYLLSHLSIKNAVLIGHMSGAVFTFAAARYHPAVVNAIVNVSGGIPILSVKQFQHMSPRQKLVAHTARFAPAILPAILKAGVRQIMSGDTLKFMQALYPKKSHDRAMVEEMNLQNLLEHGYRFSVRQGYRGFIGDAYHVVQNWSALTNNCPVRSIHVHGRHDPVVSIKSVQDFTQTQPLAELRKYEEAGQLIFYQNPEAVLAAVQELMD